MKHSEVLKLGKENINTKDKWIQNDYATNDIGMSVYGSDSTAICFCSIGSIQRVLGNEDVDGGSAPKTIWYLNKAAEKYSDGGFTNIVEANDHYDYEQVMDIWDIAIMDAENNGD